MLSPPPKATPFSFFSNSKASKASTSTTPAVVVTRRVVTVPRPVTQKPSPAASVAVSIHPPAISAKTNNSESDEPSLKRKRTDKDSAPKHSGQQRKKKSRPNFADAPARERASDSSSSSSASSSRASSRLRSSPPSSVEPFSRQSRSRSASVLCSSDDLIPRDCYTPEDGSPGGAFRSNEMVVLELIEKGISVYTAYFRNPKDKTDKSFEPHPTDYPVGELEYPNTGASERYILLAPKDADHYNPIMCLEHSLYTIVEHFLTPTQRALFGTLPSTLVSLDESSPLSSDPQRPDYLRLIRRAIHMRDGPLFLSTLAEINTLLRNLKYPPLPSDPFAPLIPNALKEAVRNWASSGLPTKVAKRIVDETYQRTVGPRTSELGNYPPFSNYVYGELLPDFISDLIHLSRLRPGMLLLDLGCGVGNVVLQAALQSGCDAFGIEFMPSPADIARGQRAQMMTRAKMWGVSMGNVELVEGNMLESERVSELMSKADVVLVNNKAFDEKRMLPYFLSCCVNSGNRVSSHIVNEAIRPKFLDLKEGALVISLAHFVSPNARLTERNIDDISAIFDVSEHKYRKGYVSWHGDPGSYYVHRVDREGYAEIRARFESSRASMGRSTRSRR
ncbi:hypothetical protein EW146_g3567 [Bondarzewia mesenterica]|uniref:Histone-lysine N-methyltransferase, H3 lysine-79 specific n=1 Tax=Bondarzewia mesenterica TaxID=1095465 RepID=A0A4V3XFE1_9AGAM|nr:hypothetical protein EW146_g3567 [Bondarzewia mesenterica]